MRTIAAVDFNEFGCCLPYGHSRITMVEAAVHAFCPDWKANHLSNKAHILLVNFDMLTPILNVLMGHILQLHLDSLVYLFL